MKKLIKSFLVWNMICQKTSKINKNISNKFVFIFIKKQMQIILRLAALAVYVFLICYQWSAPVSDWFHLDRHEIRFVILKSIDLFRILPFRFNIFI